MVNDKYVSDKDYEEKEQARIKKVVEKGHDKIDYCEKYHTLKDVYNTTLRKILDLHTLLPGMPCYVDQFQALGLVSSYIKVLQEKIELKEFDAVKIKCKDLALKLEGSDGKEYISMQSGEAFIVSKQKFEDLIAISKSYDRLVIYVRDNIKWFKLGVTLSMAFAFMAVITLAFSLVGRF